MLRVQGLRFRDVGLLQNTEHRVIKSTRAGEDAQIQAVQWRVK